VLAPFETVAWHCHTACALIRSGSAFYPGSALRYRTHNQPLFDLALPPLKLGQWPRYFKLDHSVAPMHTCPTAVLLFGFPAARM